MKALLAALACICVGAAEPALPPNAPPGSTYVSSSWPPPAYQGDTVAVVIFATDVEALCGHATPPNHIIACTTFKNGTPIIVLPNANLAPKDDFYARIVAHEAGHALGWKAWHPPL
jgi:hypothetical protein